MDARPSTIAAAPALQAQILHPRVWIAASRPTKPTAIASAAIVVSRLIVMRGSGQIPHSGLGETKLDTSFPPVKIYCQRKSRVFGRTCGRS